MYVYNMYVCMYVCMCVYVCVTCLAHAVFQLTLHLLPACCMTTSSLVRLLGLPSVQKHQANIPLGIVPHVQVLIWLILMWLTTIMAFTESECNTSDPTHTVHCDGDSRDRDGDCQICGLPLLCM